VARTDPKRRTWSTAYAHTLGRHGIGYDQPITITQRKPGAALEGALRQTLAPIQQIYTDTRVLAVGDGIGQTLWIRPLTAIEELFRSAFASAKRQPDSNSGLVEGRRPFRLSLL
jgi:hypothetical protein